MKFLATTSWLAAFAMLLALPTLAIAQTPGEHVTPDILTAAWDEGSWGCDANFGGTCFQYQGVNGLFVGNLLIAQSDTQISGLAYSQPQEFTTVNAISAGTVAPNFDQAFESTYDDSDLGDALGVTVVQTTNTSTADPNTDFVYYSYAITNDSGGDLSGIYVGNFSDWDVGAAGANHACYDDPTQLLYVWEDGQVGPYYGTAVVNGTESGWDADGSAGNPDDAGVWAAMTNGAGVCSAAPGDRRVTIGQGPFDIADGATLTVDFCMVAGDDLDDITANAAACALAAMEVAIEPGPDGLPGTHNLSAVYPNPFNPQANFTLEVAEQQSVRIAVYDALGREVATLFNGTLTAGTEHAFTIDGAGLPSGVYMVRATGEQFTDMRRVTLLK